VSTEKLAGRKPCWYCVPEFGVTPSGTQIEDDKSYTTSASIPSDIDIATFSQYSTNIIVGNLGIVGAARRNLDGTISTPYKSTGIAIYDKNSTLVLELKTRAVQKILKQ
jgi:hypothetical protein